MQSTIKEPQSQGHRQDFDKGGYMMRIVCVAAGGEGVGRGFPPFHAKRGSFESIAFLKT